MRTLTASIFPPASDGGTFLARAERGASHWTKRTKNVPTPVCPEVATLAGGRPSNLEDAIRKLDGVLTTRTGYVGSMNIGGTLEEVLNNNGLTPAVQVVFDSRKLAYEILIIYYFRVHNPTGSDTAQKSDSSLFPSVIFYLQ